jgi:hypothetical protein
MTVDDGDGGSMVVTDLLYTVIIEGTNVYINKQSGTLLNGQLPAIVGQDIPRPIGDGRISSSVSNPNGSVTGTITTSNVVTDFVTSWADQSENGNNATATDTPTLTTIGGKTFVDFAGGYFIGNELITAPFATIMCVARFSATSDIAVMFQQISEDGDNLAFYRGFDLQGGFRIFNGSNLSSSSLTNDNQTYLFGATVNNDTGTLYLNGSQDANDYCGDRVPAGTYYLGRWEGGSSTTTGLKMAEIIAHNRVLTTSERQEVESYLANKYAISL